MNSEGENKGNLLIGDNEYDSGNVLMYIYSGAGGVDAQSWAAMLLKMYKKFAERRGFKISIVNETWGEQKGIKNATIEIKGKNAYKVLKNEGGVHRLVRISPFSAKKLRHTSFALVEVLPEIIKSEFHIDPGELKIETFRSSGPGGQHMQKTESAVRITHIPTKITAEVQSERSQLQNKDKAMMIITSRLVKLMKEQHTEKLSELKAKIGPGGIEWGSQIRSYVLHPYKSVKDHRTNIKSGDPEGVLDGKLDKFIR